MTQLAIQFQGSTPGPNVIQAGARVRVREGFPVCGAPAGVTGVAPFGSSSLGPMVRVLLDKDHQGRLTPEEIQGMRDGTRYPSSPWAYSASVHSAALEVVTDG